MTTKQREDRRLRPRRRGWLALMPLVLLALSSGNFVICQMNWLSFALRAFQPQMLLL